jgi:hypothetical protein
MKRLLAVCVVVIASSCSQEDATKAPSSETDPAVQIDTDPTPQTGSGGPSQASSPDATVNGAPGAEPMENQPTSTD